jgi:ribosome production factor 2
MTTSDQLLTKVTKDSKTWKGKKVLDSRQPQIQEGTKQVAFIRGSTASDKILKLVRDIVHLKKPHGVLLNKKNNNIRPFEDPTSLEFLSDKNNCPLFVFTSHSKKRPNNLILGRTFDGHILDMFEFGVENQKLLTDFKNSKITLGVKPVLMFAGDAFETQHEYIRMKNFFMDFFTGEKTDGIRLAGIENVISFVAVEGKVYFRHYKIKLMKSGTRIPRVELEEIGPRFDLVLRRNQLASEELFRKSLKQPYQLKPKKDKNKSKSDLGTTFGRIHMEKQNFSNLNVKNMKGLKRQQLSFPSAPESMNEAMDHLSRMNPTKKARRF